MKRIALFTALLLCLQVEGKPVPKTQEKAPPKDDMASLQGEWEMVSLEQRGKKGEPSFRLTIQGDKWNVKPIAAADTESVATTTFKIDQSKNPKTIDFTVKVMEMEIKPNPGIYKLEGDILTLCRASGPLGRPTEFKTTDEGGTLVVWKRVGKVK